MTITGQQKRGRGRPTKYTEQRTRKLLILIHRGKTDAQAANIIGVTERTLNNWKKKNDDFFQSVKNAKREADEGVETSLFLRAVGMSTGEEIACPRCGFDETVKTTHWPPDLRAIIFWLRNRRPDKWAFR